MQENVNNNSDHEVYKERLLVTLTGVGCGTFFHDFSNNLIHWDERSQHILGITEPTLTFEAWFNFIYEVDRDSVAALVENDLAIQTPRINIEYRILKNGELRYLKADAFVKYKNGAAYSTYGLLHDITERKQIEEEFGRIFNISPDLIGIGNLDGYFTKINDTFEQILGYEDDEFLSKPFIEFVHDDDVEDTVAALVDAAKGEREFTIGNRYRCKDGSYKWIEWKVLALANDNIFYAAGRDFTERKLVEKALQESEEKYRALYTSMNEGVALHKIIYDETGEAEDYLIMDVNPSYEAILGIDREQVIGRKATKVYRTKEAPDLEVYAEVAESEKPVTFEAHFPPLNKHFSISVFSPGKGEFATIFTDITKRRQVEEGLRRSQKMDAVGQLTGGIAHDFNNILGVIIGNLSLIESQPSSDNKLMKRISTIAKAAQRAADLTGQMLGFSRLQAVDVELINLNQAIAHMENLISSSITPEVEVNHQFSNGPWLTALNMGDFQDSLINIVLNARDAMPYGGRLTIETRNSTLNEAYCSQHPNVNPGEYVLLSVSDTGEGIASEQIDNIYDPFYTTKIVGKGTGLGLSQVFGFVTRSNGHIEVESKLGAGTTFHLYFPRATESVLSRNSIDPQPGVLLRGDETILAVDDEEELLNLAKEYLEILGYRVLTATNGKKALERLTEHPDISLLFSDVVMPGSMSGYELADRAIREDANLKVLLTSGHTEKANRQAQQKYNLVMKPYTLEYLAQRVQSLLVESKNVPR